MRIVVQVLLFHLDPNVSLNFHWSLSQERVHIQLAIPASFYTSGRAVRLIHSFFPISHEMEYALSLGISEAPFDKLRQHSNKKES